MQKFKEFTENLMKVVLVPDDSSDSVEEVQPEPPDAFSKMAGDYMGDMDSEESSCGCGGMEDEDEGDEYSDSEGESNASVNYDTDGLKVSFNGLDITIPNDVVDKIKGVLGSDTEEGEETEYEPPCNFSNDDGDTEDEEEDDDDLQEGDALLRVAGWIAMFKGKKMEIEKNQADGIQGAKQLAIKKWNIPKEKQSLLSIEPAYAD